MNKTPTYDNKGNFSGYEEDQEVTHYRKIPDNESMVQAGQGIGEDILLRDIELGEPTSTRVKIALIHAEATKNSD